MITWRAARPEDFEYFFDLHRHTLGPYVDQAWGWDDHEQRAYLHRTIDFDTTHVIVVDGADAGRLNLVEQTGQRLEADRAVLACRITDEDRWCRRCGDKYVTVIIDLTAVREGTGPARLLDMVEGRSKQAFQQWLADSTRILAPMWKLLPWKDLPASRPPPPKNFAGGGGDGSVPCGSML